MALERLDPTIWTPITQGETQQPKIFGGSEGLEEYTLYIAPLSSAVGSYVDPNLPESILGFTMIPFAVEISPLPPKNSKARTPYLKNAAREVLRENAQAINILSAKKIEGKGGWLFSNFLIAKVLSEVAGIGIQDAFQRDPESALPQSLSLEQRLQEKLDKRKEKYTGVKGDGEFTYQGKLISILFDNGGWYALTRQNPGAADILLVPDPELNEDIRSRMIGLFPASAMSLALSLQMPIDVTGKIVVPNSSKITKELKEAGLAIPKFDFRHVVFRTLT